MGRITRKKSTGRPKNRSAGNGIDAAPENSADIPAKNASTAAAARQPVKAPVNYPGKKYVDISSQFLREVRVELRKVTWPSRKQTIGSTVVVIILVLIIAIFLGVVDEVLSRLVKLVL